MVPACPFSVKETQWDSNGQTLAKREIQHEQQHLLNYIANPVDTVGQTILTETKRQK